MPGAPLWETRGTSRLRVSWLASLAMSSASCLRCPARSILLNAPSLARHRSAWLPLLRYHNRLHWLNAFSGVATTLRGLVRKEPGGAKKPHRGLRSLTPSWWRWRTLVATKWKSGLDDHRNRLELRSILTAIRWMTRKKDRLNRRALHLTDSAVSMGAVTKCRSRSRALQPVLDKISALLLAGSIRFILAQVSTHENPADGPSHGRMAVRPKNVKNKLLVKGLASPKLAGQP
jgi:hypothetical protein